jgi:hypothetical protein
MMNSADKEKSEKPSSNFQEETPKGNTPSGNHVVKQPEDRDYTADEPEVKDMAERKENQEQPVNPIKTPPSS